MRCIGLDVHRDFCEVAIAEGGRVRASAGRIETSVAALELFAGSLAPDDQVVLEATGAAFAIARILGRTSLGSWSPTPRRFARSATRG